MIYVAIMFCVGCIIGGFVGGNNTIGIIGVVGTVGLTIFGITKHYLEQKHSAEGERKRNYNTYFSNAPSNSKTSEDKSSLRIPNRTYLPRGKYGIAEFIEEEQLVGNLSNIVIDIGNYSKSYYNKQENIICIAEDDNQTQECLAATILRWFLQASMSETIDETGNDISLAVNVAKSHEQTNTTINSDDNYVEVLVKYFENKNYECNVVTAPNQNPVVYVTYHRDYIWKVGIMIDKNDKYISIFATVFKINNEHFTEIFELINDYNQKSLYAKFICDRKDDDKYVMALYGIPLTRTTVIGDYCADRIESFIKAIEIAFRNIPSEFITV